MTNPELTALQSVSVHSDGMRTRPVMSGLAARGGCAVKPCPANARTSPRRSAKALAPQFARALAHSRSVGFAFAKYQDRLLYSLPQTLTTQPDLAVATRAALAT